ncbi:MAG: cupredoxin domain-containing protein [Microgenomates group bacterium]
MEEEVIIPQKSNSMVMGTILVLILVLVGGFLLMRSRDTATVENSTEMTQQEGMTQADSDAPADADTSMKETSDSANEDATMQTVTIEAGAFYYKPNVINAKVGDKIKVVMTSKDMMHDFMIDELGVKLPITKSGETNEVEFTATKAGTFEFYCSVGQHRKNGQVGTLIVE